MRTWLSSWNRAVQIQIQIQGKNLHAKMAGEGFDCSPIQEVSSHWADLQGECA